MYDDGGENLLPHLPVVFRFIEEGKHFGNVLVHCRQGVSRSASFVIGYLIKKNDFSVDEALGFVQGIRPIIQPNDSFVSQLRDYDRSLQPADGTVAGPQEEEDTNTTRGGRNGTGLAVSMNMCLPAPAAAPSGDDKLVSANSSGTNDGDTTTSRLKRPRLTYCSTPEVH